MESIDNSKINYENKKNNSKEENLNKNGDKIAYDQENENNLQCIGSDENLYVEEGLVDHLPKSFEPVMDEDITTTVKTEAEDNLHEQDVEINEHCEVVMPTNENDNSDLTDIAVGNAVSQSAASMANSSAFEYNPEHVFKNEKCQVDISQKESNSTDSENRFKCNVCGYECNHRTSYVRHLLIHSETKMYRCPKCNYETNLKSNLKRHILIHSETKLFKCSECSYACNCRASLKTHILTHSGVKLFKCPLPGCPYESNIKSKFNIHLLSHSDKKLMKCSQCDYECNTITCLKRHALTHSDVKLYSCEQCSYACNDKTSLKRHVLTHTGIKLFHCSQCDFKTNRKNRLTLHMGSHSDSDPYRTEKS